jgi:hypothetical protein
LKSREETPSPDSGKRLLRCFEHARMQISEKNYDYATELLAQCVLADPGNLIYVRNFISSLQKKYGQNKKGTTLARFKERGARSAMKKAVATDNWDEAFRSGITVLRINPWDVSALTSLATACEKLSAGSDGSSRSAYADCELFYLKCALEVAPKDLGVCKRLATALDKRKRLDETRYSGPIGRD